MNEYPPDHEGDEGDEEHTRAGPERRCPRCGSPKIVRHYLSGPSGARICDCCGWEAWPEEALPQALLLFNSIFDGA